MWAKKKTGMRENRCIKETETEDWFHKETYHLGEEGMDGVDSGMMGREMDIMVGVCGIGIFMYVIMPITVL